MNVLDWNNIPVIPNQPEASSIIDIYRQNLLLTVDKTCAEVRGRREAKGYNSVKSFSEHIFDNIIAAVKDSSPLFPIDIFEMEFIERWTFQADIAFKSTHLLSTNKSAYFKDYCPQLVSILKEVKIQGTPVFEDVKAVGIYVNAKLPADMLFKFLDQVLLLGEDYGESSGWRGQDIAIDYSSPNAAKHVMLAILDLLLSDIYSKCTKLVATQYIESTISMTGVVWAFW